jgi:hypothetical protein
VTRTLRFYVGLTAVALLCIVAGRAIAQEVRTQTRMTVSPDTFSALREGMQVRLRTEPARAQAVLKMQPNIALAAFPSCRTVPAAYTLPGGNNVTLQSAANYGSTGCGSFVIDYQFPAGMRPHEDYGASSLPMQATVAPVGGISVPNTQADCNAYHEEARYWWRHLPQGSDWHFSYAAHLQGLWTAGACRLFAKDEDSKFAHVPWNPSSAPYILRGAFEARIGETPQRVAVRSTWMHTHAVLPIRPGS